MLDVDLARPNGIKQLNEAVKRNRVRIPADSIEAIMEEVASLRSHTATSKGTGYKPDISICFYSAGCCHAVQCVEQRIDHRREY
jgi:hypothetical protein